MGIVPYNQQFGGCSEFVLIPQDSLLPCATTLEPGKLCSAIHSGLLAYTAVYEKISIRKGETILVLGALNMVGCFVVQLAALLGGHVFLCGMEPLEIQELKDNFQSSFTTIINQNNLKDLADTVLNQ